MNQQGKETPKRQKKNEKDVIPGSEMQTVFTGEASVNNQLDQMLLA